MPYQPPPDAGFRARVFKVWQGPHSISIPDLFGGFFSGWQTVTLDALVRQVGRVEAEVRSVYADPYADSTNRAREVAVLRAVYWNQVESREAARSARDRDEEFQLALPARLVEIPIERVNDWFVRFARMDVPLLDPVIDDEASVIRRLRLDLNLSSQIFEKRWQALDERHAALNEQWERVWSEMSDLLETAPRISDVASFRDAKERAAVDIVYDLDAYHPYLSKSIAPRQSIPDHLELRDR